jgi:hypothetical protein
MRKFIVLPWVSILHQSNTCLINRLLAVLHPKHKLEYFWQAGWTSDWIDTAEALVRDEFEHSYMAVYGSDCEDEFEEVDNESIVESEKVCLNCCLVYLRSLTISY